MFLENALLNVHPNSKLNRIQIGSVYISNKVALQIELSVDTRPEFPGGSVFFLFAEAINPNAQGRPQPGVNMFKWGNDAIRLKMNVQELSLLKYLFTQWIHTPPPQRQQLEQYLAPMFGSFNKNTQQYNLSFYHTKASMSIHFNDKNIILTALRFRDNNTPPTATEKVTIFLSASMVVYLIDVLFYAIQNLIPLSGMGAILKRKSNNNINNNGYSENYGYNNTMNRGGYASPSYNVPSQQNPPMQNSPQGYSNPQGNMYPPNVNINSMSPQNNNIPSTMPSQSQSVSSQVPPTPPIPPTSTNSIEEVENQGENSIPDTYDADW